MTIVFFLLTTQAVLGAFDNLWHHELDAKLPQRLAARRELKLHSMREAIYSVVFLGLAWLDWNGGFALALAALVSLEIVITLADFLEEDRSRRLPPFERVLHTLLAISYGLFVGTLAPVLLEWSQRATALHPTSHGGWSWLLTVFAVGVLAWSIRNALAVQRLGRVAKPALSLPRQLPGGHVVAPTVLVTGATGFIGTALVAELQQEGVRVIALSRDARQAQGMFGPSVWVIESLDAIPTETRLDAIVNLAGARVLGRPWTASRRRELLNSRIGVTKGVVDLVRRLQQAPRVLVSASAVGFYGASPEASFEARDEASAPRPGEFQSDLCVAIEHEARRAEALGVRVVRLRFGVVIGRGGGAYPMLAMNARIGLGAVLGFGRQPAPWVHLCDAIGLIRFAIECDSLEGPVNAVAPDVPPQQRFAEALAKSFGRRARMRIPDAPLRALAGEMASLLLDGQNAVPRTALSKGYVFRFPTLEDALCDLAKPAA